MSFGITLYNAKGKEFFNTDTQSWNYIGAFVAPANGNGYGYFVTLSMMTEVIFQRSAVDNPPSNQEGYIHTVYRSGNNITATGGNIRTLVTVLGR